MTTLSRKLRYLFVTAVSAMLLMQTVAAGHYYFHHSDGGDVHHHYHHHYDHGDNSNYHNNEDCVTCKIAEAVKDKAHLLHQTYTVLLPKDLFNLEHSSQVRDGKIWNNAHSRAPPTS